MTDKGSVTVVPQVQVWPSSPSFPPRLWLHKEHHSSSSQKRRKRQQLQTCELFFLFPAYARSFPSRRLVRLRSSSSLLQL